MTKVWCVAIFYSKYILMVQPLHFRQRLFFAVNHEDRCGTVYGNRLKGFVNSKSRHLQFQFIQQTYRCRNPIDFFCRWDDDIFIGFLNDSLPYHSHFFQLLCFWQQVDGSHIYIRRITVVMKDDALITKVRDGNTDIRFSYIFDGETAILICLSSS